jgi:hypothetical protein
VSAVTGGDLVDELKQVAAPATSGFSVRDVPSAPGYKIGRGVDGVVALLTPPDPTPDPPTSLRTLQLAPRIRVSIEGDDGAMTEAEHGLVQLAVEDDEMLEPFLAVAAAVVRLLGPHPAPGQVSAGMRRLVKIFDPALPPRGSVLGLWAELLLILRSAQPMALVDAWHAHVDARFDFSAEGSRLEVKATTKDERVHMFNLRQLKPVTGADVTIASVMTTETGAGTAIGDLVERLEHALAGDGPRQMKLHTQVADTLGSDWARHLGRRFDERQAEESLVFLHPGNVPQVDEGPTEVLEVGVTVDCTDVPVDSAPQGLAALIASPTSAPKP